MDMVSIQAFFFFFICKIMCTNNYNKKKSLSFYAKMKISGVLNFKNLTLHTLYYVILTAVFSLGGGGHKTMPSIKNIIGYAVTFNSVLHILNTTRGNNMNQMRGWNKV